MFWITFLSLTFAPTIFYFAGYFPAFISVSWNYFWVVEKCYFVFECKYDSWTLTFLDQSHMFSLFILQFPVTGHYLGLFSFHILHFPFHPSYIGQFYRVEGHELFSLKSFFHCFFSPSFEFCFSEMALSWELIFFLNFVGSKYWCDDWGTSMCECVSGCECLM